jgi:cytidyltransferase-like protein
MIPVISGGFDPIHSGHITLIQAAAAKYNNQVVVLLNSDSWLIRKKGKAFMPYAERKNILQAMKQVDVVIDFDDGDNTACAGLEKLKAIVPHKKLVFCNGGDRTSSNIPEMNVDGIEFDFGVGGENKMNSSSWILRDALAYYKEDRLWGTFYNLYEVRGCKVKELVIKPGKGISYQKHNQRGEVWFVREGEGKIRFGSNTDKPLEYTVFDLKKNDVQVIRCGNWHKLWNEDDKDLVIIEIQYGEYLGEDDIIRLE